MKIALVTETYPPEINGVSHTVKNFVDGLLASSNEVVLVRPWQKTDVESPRDAFSGLVEYLMPGMSLPGYQELRLGLPCAGSLRKLLKMENVQCIYIATEGFLGKSAIKVAREMGLPVVTGFHTRFDEYMDHYGLPGMKRIALKWLRNFHNQAAVTLVPTDALKVELEDSGIHSVRVLQRALDTELFHPDWRDNSLRRHWGVKKDDLVLLHVGRLANEKNLPLLVESYHAIRKFRQDVHLIIVGDGPYRQTLEKSLPEAIFTGMLKGTVLSRYYASADMFLFPSLTETFGNVTLEALASGVPVVAFDYGAANIHVEHGVNGMLADYADEERFLDLVLELGLDRELLRGASQAARLSVQSLSLESVSTDLLTVFKHLLTENKVSQVA